LIPRQRSTTTRRPACRRAESRSAHDSHFQRHRDTRRRKPAACPCRDGYDRVIDPSRLRLPGGLFHTRVDQVRAERESTLARIVEDARLRGVPAQFLIWEGDPGAVTIDAAEAEGADVIVVGSHARGPVGRLLLGSVSSYVVDHSRRPVVVIRPGQRLVDVWPTEASGGGAIVGPQAARPSV
jgi:nucleotide-binding universal stress UspA family protein